MSRDDTNMVRFSTESFAQVPELGWILVGLSLQFGAHFQFLAKWVDSASGGEHGLMSSSTSVSPVRQGPITRCSALSVTGHHHASSMHGWGWVGVASSMAP